MKGFLKIITSFIFICSFVVFMKAVIDKDLNVLQTNIPISGYAFLILFIFVNEDKENKIFKELYTSVSILSLILAVTSLVSLIVNLYYYENYSNVLFSLLFLIYHIFLIPQFKTFKRFFS